MSDGGEWGPWIEHDGKALPKSFPRGAPVQLAIKGNGIVPHEGDGIPADWPGFIWSWRLVPAGPRGFARKRVCEQPDYAPILRYRIRRPRALLELIDQVENLPAPVPEGADA